MKTQFLVQECGHLDFCFGFKPFSERQKAPERPLEGTFLTEIGI